MGWRGLRGGSEGGKGEGRESEGGKGREGVKQGEGMCEEVMAME